MLFPQLLPQAHMQLMPSIVPAGSVIAFAGNISAPVDPSKHTVSDPPNLVLESQGWMVCDGRVLSIANYGALYAVIGDLYSDGQQGNGNFCIPDYRGYFLRMVDLNSGHDPDAGQRTPVGKNNASDPGSFQGDALQEHVHQVNNAKVPQIPMGGEGSKIDSLQGDSGVPATAPNAKAVKTSPNETRPVNISVYYLIKFIP